MKSVFCATGFLTLGTALFADPITVHNTGVNGTDALVAAGAATSFWQLTSQPAGAGYALGSTPFRYYNGAYVADSPVAAWVSPAANGNAGVSGFYTYSLTIDLTGLNPTTAAISGKFGTDNDGSIGVNTSAPVISGGFSSLTPFSITSGFVSGLNTINVRVNNAGDPTAFFVTFDSATASVAQTPGGVPDFGSTLVLALLGLASLVFARRNLVKIT